MLENPIIHLHEKVSIAGRVPNNGLQSQWATCCTNIVKKNCPAQQDFHLC